MLDQTFSAKNFMNVYSQENRMGRIPVETMGQGFQTVVEEMKTVNSELQELKSLKKSKKTDDIKKKIDELKKKQKDLKENKQKVLFEELQGLSKQVNSYAFHFKLEKVWIGDKMGFKINSKNHAQLFAMKQLQTNLQKTFKVKQANRHLIMTNIKLLLKTKRPYYIIRTDVSSFFESIPQDQLRHTIMDNTLLSYKSKVFVNAILKEYEIEKAKLKDDERDGMKDGCGVPRGIGMGIDYLKNSLDKLVKEYNEYVSIEDSDLDDYEPINPQILGVVFTMVQYYGEKPISALRPFIAQTKQLGFDVFEDTLRENKTLFADAAQYGVPVVISKRNSGINVIDGINGIVDELLNKL